MPRRSLPFPVLIVPGCVDFVESENSLWVATPSGDVVTFRLLDSRLSLRGGGYTQPVAVMPAPDGLSVLVLEAGGRLLRAARDEAAESDAVIVAELEHGAAAGRLHPDGGVLVLEAAEDARLLHVDVVDGTVLPVAEGLANPAAFTVEPSTRTAVVLERTAAGPRLVAVDIDNGTKTPLGASGAATALVTSPGSTPGVIVAAGPNGESMVKSLGPAAATPGPTVGAEVRALARWGSLVLAVTATSIEAIEWDLADGVLPVMVPIGPAFVRGWFTADLNPAAIGIAESDVELVVDEGPLAATVSAGVEPAAPGGGRRVRVVTGPIPGEYHLTARRKSDGSVLGRARFRITRHWPDREIGPPISFTGTTHYFESWGGGPNAPQNIGNNKAPEHWRVAVVFVSTSDRRLPGDLTAIKSEWKDRLVKSPPSLSARTYYEEVSFHSTPAAPGGPTGTTISLIEPMFSLDLEKAWGDYFEQPMNKGTWRGWNPQQTARNIIAGAFSDALDASGQGDLLQQIDAVLFVVQTASEALTVVGTKLALAKYVWPQATRADFYRRKQQPNEPTTWTFGEKPIMFMPSHLPGSMPATGTLKEVSDTNILCHELGHTLGLPDLYNNGDLSDVAAARVIGALDLMGSDKHLPHFSVPNRMRLGWIGANWIERFDFSVNSSSRNVVLHAAEALARSGPPAGRAAGIEIRVRDGWNYYFEYRRKQPTQKGDQELDKISPTAQLVVGTDVIVLGNTGMMAGADENVRRPRILLLPADADGDGPVLDVLGEDYEETDLTNPDAAHDFRLRFNGVDAADPNAMRVRVEYVDSRRADLRIRPAPGQGNWKSPDIDLEGPKGVNVVAKGLEHTIVVRVRNAGTEDARSVRVRVSWLPFTTSPGLWTPLTDPALKDIPKGQTVEFRVPWIPKAVKIGGESAEHFCVKAEVDRYVDPSDPTHSEIVVGNNGAQSNFDSTDVAFGSPSERRTTGFTVTNRQSHLSTFLTAVDQDSPLCRIYVGNAWMRLEPGQTAAIQFAYESLAGDPIEGNHFEQEFERLARHPPPMLSLTSLVIPEETADCDAPQVVWGSNLSIRIGRRTRVRIEGLFERVVRGTVVALEDGQEQVVDRGRVNVVLWTAERPEEQYLCGDNVNAAGRFDAVIPPEIFDASENGLPILGEALYLGTWPWAASRSGTRRLR